MVLNFPEKTTCNYNLDNQMQNEVFVSGKSLRYKQTELSQT